MIDLVIRKAKEEDCKILSIIKQKVGTKRAEAKIIKIVKREKETVVGMFQKNKSSTTAELLFVVIFLLYLYLIFSISLLMYHFLNFPHMLKMVNISIATVQLA